MGLGIGLRDIEFCVLYGVKYNDEPNPTTNNAMSCHVMYRYIYPQLLPFSFTVALTIKKNIPSVPLILSKVWYRN